MSQQFIEQFTVPATTPYTYNLLNPTGATLVQVQSAAGVPVTGCSITAGVLTVPSTEANAVLWVIYDATPTSSYSGSKAQAGRGTIVKIGSTVIGEVSDAPINRGKWETVDTTNFESGNDSEYLQTIRKGQATTIKGNRLGSLDAGQAAVETAWENGTAASFTITIPKNGSQTTVGDSYTFNALVLSFDFSVQPTKQIEFSIDLQPTGGYTFTPGS